MLLSAQAHMPKHNMLYWIVWIFSICFRLKAKFESIWHESSILSMTLQIKFRFPIEIRRK